MTKREHHNIYRWIHRNSYYLNFETETKVINLDEILEYLKTLIIEKRPNEKENE